MNVRFCPLPESTPSSQKWQGWRYGLITGLPCLTVNDGAFGDVPIDVKILS